MEFEAQAVSEAELARLVLLAQEVAAELRRAGFRAEIWRDWREYRGLDGDSGVEVQVDRFDDELGGARVCWQSSAELVQEIGALLLNRHESTHKHPVLEHHWTIHVAMTDALLTIMRSAGFEAEIDDAPYELRVLAGPRRARPRNVAEAALRLLG